MTHGHELSGGRNAGGMGVVGQRRIKRRKKWDNCNSIINKNFLCFYHERILDVVKKMPCIN